jgi:hypothetical protein
MACCDGIRKLIDTATHLRSMAALSLTTVTIPRADYDALTGQTLERAHQELENLSTKKEG